MALELYPVNAPPNPGTGAVYYYHADNEGSVRLLTDATGAVANRYDYDSFGQRILAAESVAQNYSWKGRDFINGPNLIFNRARIYDPQIGRFISQDPLAWGGGDYNLYNFAWNNPKNWNDPQGTTAIEQRALFGVSTGVIAGTATRRLTFIGLSAIGRYLEKQALRYPVRVALGCALGLAIEFAPAVANSDMVMGVDQGNCVWQTTTKPADSPAIPKPEPKAAPKPEDPDCPPPRPKGTPDDGPPNTWLTNPGSGQERYYGPEGQRMFDIDWDHNHNNVGVPHSHRWLSPTNRTPAEPGIPEDFPPGRCPK